MAGMTDAEEARVLDDRFDNQRDAANGHHLALSSTTPGEDGTNFTEPTEASYDRVSISTTDWDAAVQGDPTTKDNGSTFTFPEATEDWASGSNLTHFGVYDDTLVNGGTLIYFGALDTAKAVQNGDTAQFDPGDITIQLGDPGDTF